VIPATPPPAITAVVHFTIGGRSVITAADTTVPATNAAGVANASIISEDFAECRYTNMIRADGDPSQAKLSLNGRCPV
jgi:hypothetical protein